MKPPAGLQRNKSSAWPGAENKGMKSMNTNEAKQTVAFALGELRQSLEAGKSESLQRYLDFISKFNRYSFNNTMLIMEQCPMATMVAGYSTWKKHGRFVRKGETGIQIYAPIVRGNRKTTTDSRLDRVDAKRDAVLAVSEQNGQNSGPDTEEPLFYRMVSVFDVSQTDGNELVELTRFADYGLVGKPGACLNKLESIFERMGLVLETKQLPGLTRGYSIGKYVAVREGLSDTMRFRVLLHELAHSIMHFKKQSVPSSLDIYLGPPSSKPLVHSMEELEAESVAYTVCRACGVDSSAISSDYITLHEGDGRMLAESMSRIQIVSGRILDAMNKPTQWQTIESEMAA